MDELTTCECDGRGVWTEWDGDSEDPRRIRVVCEGCAGYGHLVPCWRCGDGMTVPEADASGALCGPCSRELEAADQAEEMNRIGRRVA